MSEFFTWQMVKIAVENLNSNITNKAIHTYINNRWPGVNPGTLRATIIILTVNHDSRIHYPENSKPRLTTSGSIYDYLFRTERGKIERYNPGVHGVWEISLDVNQQLIVHQSTVTLMPIVYTPADILWIKNVTNTLIGEAYLSLTANSFILHFPTHHKGNVLKASIDELILIYQRVHGTQAFTHLVTPIDDVLIVDEDRPNFRYGRRVKIVAKTPADSLITVKSTAWALLNFSGFSQGNACKIENISSVVNGDELRIDIWERFKDFFVAGEKHSVTTTASLINELGTTNPDLTVTEGELKLVKHLARERNRLIISEKKQQALNNNTFFCEVCTFSFITIFSVGFIECHHIIPISTPGRSKETSLDDLALVCANCHRMLHTKFDGEYLAIDQLKERIVELSI